MTKKVLIAIADGSEEIEALTAYDLLKRAGAEVTLASPEGGFVSLSRGLTVVSDCAVSEVADESFDLVVLPGGLPGAYNLRDCEALDQIIKKRAEKGEAIAAICAAPAFILAEKGVLDGYEATCYPSCEEGYSKTKWRTEEPVVCDRNIITGKGPGAAYLFALKLVEFLYDKSARQQLENDTMFN